MSDEQEVIGIKRICEILPHRYPFLMVDSVVHLDLENDEIIAKKNLTFNEQFFQGHFPNFPIMPGVLQIEALAQAGGILAYEKGIQDRIAVLLKMNKAKFRKPVHPGDTLYLCVKGIHFGTIGAKVWAEARLNAPEGPITAEAEITCALVERSQL